MPLTILDDMWSFLNAKNIAENKPVQKTKHKRRRKTLKKIEKEIQILAKDIKEIVKEVKIKEKEEADKIRELCSMQKKRWQEISNLIVEIRGYDNMQKFDYDLEQAREYGLWLIDATMKDGYISLAVNMKTGELVAPEYDYHIMTNGHHPATDQEVIKINTRLDQIYAAPILKHLKTFKKTGKYTDKNIAKNR